MKASNSFEKFIKEMSPQKFKFIESKGLQMEAEIEEISKKFETVVMEGHCENESVTVKVDGKHQLLDIHIDPTKPELTTDRIALCNQITEAVNDAAYKIDLMKEKEVSNIKYRYRGEVIDKLG